MRKHWTIVTGLLVIGSVWLTACSDGKSGQSSVDSDKPAEQAKSYANEPAELVIYGAPGDPPEVWNERFGDQLQKKFPNYKFTYIQRSGTNTIENMIASGAQVDLIYDSVGNAVNSVVATGSQLDLSELVKKHNVDMSRFEPATVEAVKQFGGLYGFPVHSGGLVLYYNKAIFDKFGVGYPKDGMTWDEAIELGNKLTRNDNGTQYIGLGQSYIHVLSMNAYSLPFVDKATEKAAINSDKYKKIVDTLIMAPAKAIGYKEQIATLKRLFNNNDFMKERNIAMYVMNFGLQGQKDFESLDWDMAALPVFKDNPGMGTQPYPNFLFISNASKYKDQAMEVLKYVTSDETQLALSKKGYIPVLKNESIKNAFAQDSNVKNKNVVKAVFTNKFASPIARTKYDGKLNSPLQTNLIKAILGEIDLNTALRQTEEEVNKAIEAEKKK
ncbi:ABC transporter substrate-binding protein [Paenibacillus allorhizosphaerae]|uniref:Extracellular solute-binding protein n=1 Tax=Paenibacillus allorhizosphaerae TaxID=2849866 RepID=A0ABM8V9X6_9BACL|nr:extracellular solute-binding protein [Paenibacillus allorhizosphaerae]CAG7614767.1 hypothetical protein PAECIP111802_00107 [Paenibacillus allorhizosphaerae]